MKYYLLSITLLLSISGFSQSQSELDAIISNIKSNIIEVATAKETYKQSLESPKSCVIKYSYDEVNLKGEIETLAFEFNLADLDAYTIREETKGDIIYLVATTNNKQKLIKTYKNGEVGNYSYELNLITKNVDNARILIDEIKKAIPIAKKITESKFNINSYEEMTNWLVANVKDVRLGDVTYKQKIEKGSYPGTLKFMKTEVGAKSSKEEIFEFNLADLNINSVLFNISGNKFGVGAETLRKQKIINYHTNGTPDGFDDEFVIATEDVEQARDIKTVLSLAIKAAKPVVDAAMSSLGTDYLNLSAKYVQEVNYGDTKISQSFEPKCITNIELIDQDPKSTKKNTYQVHLIDINENALVYDVSSSKMYLDFLVKNKNKLVKETENDEFDGYIDDFKVYTPNVEIARRLQFAVKKSIEKCKSDFKKPYSDNYNDVIKWFFNSVGEFTVDQVTYKQSLEFVEDGNNDKFRLTKTKIDAKGGVEEVYELNVSDINPRTINYRISGKVLAVEFETNFKDKIIKYYKDGEIKNYLYGLEIVYDDIEKARNAISALTYLAEQKSK